MLDEFNDSTFSAKFWRKRGPLSVDERAPKRVKSVQMCPLTAHMVRKRSVCEVIQPSMYEKNLPKPNSINDLRMGTVDSAFKCMTCKNFILDCGGHDGKIELAMPVFHTFFLSTIVKILRSICHSCHKIILSPTDCFLLRAQKLPCKQRFLSITSHTKNKKICANCSHAMPTIKSSAFTIKREWPAKILKQKKNPKPQHSLDPHLLLPLTPENTRQFLQLVSDEDYISLGLKPVLAHPQHFIITTLHVPSVTIRPSVIFGGSTRQKGHDDLTTKLMEILKTNIRLHKEIALAKSPDCKKDDKDKYLSTFEALQTQTATYMNNESSQGKSQSKKRSGLPEKSLSKRLKGKRGRWRGNVMGKRVNHSARSPITPDPNINVEQLGVPLQIATSLTFPVMVTKHNIIELQQRVNIGFGKLLGAHSVDLYNSDTISLQYCKLPPQLTLGSTVHRYLMDDDVILFNRQPSLRKKSIMAHKVKIMRHKSFRLNLATTQCYNADFDGDEMTLHALQTVEALAEAKELLAIDKQILNAQNAKPCMSIVQDSLVGAHCLTKKDAFLTKHQMMDLMMTLPQLVDIPIPAILKPQPLWTGKQAMSLILPHITIINKDLDLHISKGQLLSGTLCKKSLGATSGGIIHQTCKLISETAALDFINACQRLCNQYLETEGVSIGLSDCLTDKHTSAKVQETIDTCVAQAMHIESLGTQLNVPFAQREQAVSRILGQVLGVTGSIVNDAMTAHNSFGLMVKSGSKGSLINIAQVTACVAQQSIDGKRVMKKNHREQRTLNYFPKDCQSIESRGFVFRPYIKGIQPIPMFFHDSATFGLNFLLFRWQSSLCLL